MENECIKLCYKKSDCIITFELSRQMCEEANKNELIMSIGLVIGGYHGNGAFRASIKLNAKCIPERNTTMISRIVKLHCKKENGEITGNTVMEPIGNRPKNISAGIFIGWKHEGKTQLIMMTHGCTLPPPRKKTICNAVRPSGPCAASRRRWRGPMRRWCGLIFVCEH